MTIMLTQHQDLSQVPLDTKKYYYLDDDLVKAQVVSSENNEKLVHITEDDANISISPFWEERQELAIDDAELGYIINLENNRLQEYVTKKKDFGILVREGVYERLVNANNLCKKQGYFLSVKIGLRPVEVQAQLFEDIFLYFQKIFSGQSKEKIYKHTCEYISDPNNYISPHTTGGAVDLVLVQADGAEVDMGFPINYPGKESYLDYEHISKTQRANREYLADVMLSVGFANLASEWWHFSYGDMIWAYFYGKKESYYSSASYT